MSDSTEFSRSIYFDEVKGTQVRVTINEFRGLQYLHIRKYFQDFYGEWVPTKDGISFPLTIPATLSLFLALSEIMSNAEKDLIDDALKGIIESYNTELVLDDDIPF